jgi:LysR family glycine cleavage system transcriptional activator
MKRGRLPLTALRSFEAAGRHLSFSRAAEELFVSQAAISRQIRELEGLVGRPLFERQHRRVVLTEPGRTLLDQLTVSLDDIDRRRRKSLLNKHRVCLGSASSPRSRVPC